MIAAYRLIFQLSFKGLTIVNYPKILGPFSP